jgi:hypothetical protein
MKSIPGLRVTCPSDVGETAEAFIMKRLPTADALQFAIHILACRRCALAVEDAGTFVHAMKVAARRVRAERGDKPRLCSKALLTGITPTPPGGVRVQMRFEVTACGTPCTQRCRTPFEIP